MSGRLRTILAGATILLAASTAALGGLPAVKQLAPSPISTDTAENWYNTHPGGNTHTNGLCGIDSTLCGRAIAIRELARSLSRGGALSPEQFTLNTFEYVYKNIDTEFRYGLSKGAFGALLDQSGTPFDQAHLMVEILKQGMADFPASYPATLAPTYLAGTVTLDSGEFTSWTGIPSTSAKAACQLLGSGGIPFSFGSSFTTPGDCNTVTGNISTVTLSHIWVSVTFSTEGTLLYDPSYKAYIQRAPVGLASIMQCTSQSCGSQAEDEAIPAGNQTESIGGFSVKYVEGVQYSALGSKLNLFGTRLQHYIEGSSSPTAAVSEIAGGRIIDLTSMPTPGQKLPYDSNPAVQHTWTGDIPNQYRSKLRIQFDNIDATLFADETYGYWLQLAGSYDGVNPHKHYMTLFYEREKGTNAANTQNLLYSYEWAPGPTATNEIVPLATSTIIRGNPNVGTLSLTADHPYAAGNGTFGDDNLTSKVDPGPPQPPAGPADYSYPMYIVQAWGRTGPGSEARAGKLASDKHSMHWQYGFRTVSGSAIPGEAYLQYNISVPSIMAAWLSQAGKAVDISDGMAQTRTEEHGMLGVVTEAGGYLLVDAIGSLSVTSKSANATNQQAAFNTSAVAYDAFEGSALEQNENVADGANSIRWFQITNGLATPNRFYEVTPSNKTAVENNALANYNGGNSFYGPPLNTVNNYLNSASPTFSMIVPKNAYAGPGKIYGPLLAYSSDGGQIAYLLSTGQKGADSAESSPDPMNSVMQTVRDTGASKPLAFDVSVGSGNLSIKPKPDIVSGAGPFPASLSYQRYYNSSQIQTASCSVPGSGYFSCIDPHYQRLAQGWTDNFQIDAHFSNDAPRALGQDSALEASGVIAALYTIQSLNLAADFNARVTTIFCASWLEDQVMFNGIVVSKPPNTETFIYLPDGRYNPRPGTSGNVVQTGSPITGPGFPSGGVTTELTETDAQGASLKFALTSGNTQSLFRYIPTTWTFPNNQVVTFTYGDYSQGNYVEGGLLTKVTNSFGNQLNFQSGYGYTSQSIDDGAGHTVAITYSSPSANALWSSAASYTVQEPDGHSWVYNFDHIGTKSGLASSRVNQIFLPSDHSNPFLTFDFDGLRRTLDAVDGYNHATTYFPASVGVQERVSHGAVVDRSGYATDEYFNDKGNLLQLTDPVGNVTTHQYDGAGRLTQTTYPEHNYDAFTYDVRSNLLSTTNHPKPGSNEDGTTIASSTAYVEAPGVFVCANFAVCNKPNYETNARSFVTDYSWYATGLLSMVKTGLNSSFVCQVAGGTCPETDFQYTAYSGVQLLTQATKKIDAAHSLVTQYDYDTTNHDVLKTVTADPTGLNLISTFFFDGIGNLTQVNGPRTDVADISNYEWDADRHLTFSVGPDPDGSGSHPRIAKRYQYDYVGRVKEIDDGTTQDTSTNFTQQLATNYYFNNNSMTSMKTVGPDSSHSDTVTQYSYKFNDWPNCTAIRMDRNSNGTFNDLPTACSQSASKTSYGDDQITEFYYFGTGQVQREVRGFGSVGIAENYAVYTYTPNGKQLTVQDAMGSTHKTTYAYDGFDRLSLTTFAFPDITEHLTYDPDGNVLTREHPNVWPTTTYTYDPLDRVAKKSYPAVSGVSAANTMTWSYDLAGNATLIVDQLSNVLINCYDLVGQLTSETAITDGSSGTCGTTYNMPTKRTVSYQRNQAGDRTRVTWPDAYYVSYGFDAANRMLAACEQGTYSSGACSGTTTLATFDYDNLGNPAYTRYWNNGAIRASVGTGYSAGGDLSSLSHELADSNSISYQNDFDPAHRIVDAKVTTTNGAYGYVPVTATDTYPAADVVNAYEHDIQHNGGTTHLAYDGHFNMKQAGPWIYAFDPEDRLTTASGPPGNVAYTYDPLNRRTSKSGTAVTNSLSFLSSGDDEIAEYAPGATTPQRRFIPGTAVDHPIAMVANGTKEFFHQDKIGNVVAMSDVSGHLIEGPFAYDPFGNGPSATGVPFKFTGRRLDPETGLYYYRARYYSSAVGRFLSADPLGYQDDLNMFTYVGNDPTDKSDPSGKFVQEAGALACGPYFWACAIGLGVGTVGVVWWTADHSKPHAVHSDAPPPQPPPEQKTPEETKEVVGEITGGVTPDRITKGNTQIWNNSPTGKTQDEVINGIANQDGAKVNVINTPKGTVTVVTLPSGTKVIGRPSTAGDPTVEVQRPDGRKVAEIRYPRPPPPEQLPPGQAGQ